MLLKFGTEFWFCCTASFCRGRAPTPITFGLALEVQLGDKLCPLGASLMVLIHWLITSCLLMRRLSLSPNEPKWAKMSHNERNWANFGHFGYIWGNFSATQVLCEIKYGTLPKCITNNLTYTYSGSEFTWNQNSGGSECLKYGKFHCWNDL